MTMGGRAVLIWMMILVLATVGCEREDLHYDAPEKPDTEDKNPSSPTDEKDPSAPNDDDPSTPTDANNRLAELLAGEWQGCATMDFIDSDNQWKHNEFDDVRLSFTPIERGATWGSGKEADYRDDKRVWMMAFTWQVDSTDAVILKYADGRLMTSKKSKYDLDDNTFHATFVSRDQTETDEYTLTRVKP